MTHPGFQRQKWEARTTLVTSTIEKISGTVENQLCVAPKLSSFLFSKSLLFLSLSKSHLTQGRNYHWRKIRRKVVWACSAMNNVPFTDQKKSSVHVQVCWLAGWMRKSMEFSLYATSYHLPHFLLFSLWHWFQKQKPRIAYLT